MGARAAWRTGASRVWSGRPSRRSFGRSGLLTWLGRRLLLVYWASCLTVIALGLDSLYPDVRPALAALLAVPFKEPSSPASGAAASVLSPLPLRPPLSASPANRFHRRAAAHAAGVYDIPI